MHIAIAEKSSDSSSSASDFFLFRLGRALVFYQDVNAPGNVYTDLGASIDLLWTRHTRLSANLTQWSGNWSSKKPNLFRSMAHHAT